MKMKEQKIITDILEESTLHKNQYNKYNIRIKTIQGSLKFYEGNETWLKGQN
jgi:hypothetical protein